MEKPTLDFVTPEILELFELFDWWQPSRLADETGLGLDKLKTLIRLRKDFKLHKNPASNVLSETQVDIATSFSRQISLVESKALAKLLPVETGGNRFRFIDLFAGIGGIRKPFDEIGGRCVMTCEWDEYAQKTYRANWRSPDEHIFVDDIKEITQPTVTERTLLSGSKQLASIKKSVPHHHVLLAGFPCQPFSIAGVSKKNALNRAHGFDCEDQGQLFFDICRILAAKQPAIAVLENVKNLKSHDKGNTFRVITEMLTNLPAHHDTLFSTKSRGAYSGYWIANLDDTKPDYKIIDGQHFVPQHRERVILLCIRKDLAEISKLKEVFDLSNIKKPESRKKLKDILDSNESVEEKYTLTPKLWKYLEDYAIKHKAKGNGFGYGMVYRNDKNSVARTLSARYYKDGSEILINQDEIKKRPRRLTPQECARLMGFVDKSERFRIPVSDTRAYKQFGNSVVVPVFSAIAALIEPNLDKIVRSEKI